MEGDMTRAEATQKILVAKRQKGLSAVLGLEPVSYRTA